MKYKDIACPNCGAKNEDIEDVTEETDIPDGTCWFQCSKCHTEFSAKYVMEFEEPVIYVPKEE